MSNWNICWNDKMYPRKWYAPEDGCIGHCAFDSETSLIKPGMVADFVIGTAYNGKTLYYITKDQMKTFMDNHKNKMVFMANASFDLNVLEKIKAIKCALLEAEVEKHVIDLLLLQKLYAIATTGRDVYPSLDALAGEYLKLKLPKDAKVKISPDVYLMKPSLSVDDYENSAQGLKTLIKDIKSTLNVIYKELIWNGDNSKVSFKEVLGDLKYYLDVDIKETIFKESIVNKDKSQFLKSYRENIEVQNLLRSEDIYNFSDNVLVLDLDEMGEKSKAKFFSYKALFQGLIDLVDAFKAEPFRLVRVSYGNFLNEDLTVDYKSMEPEAFWYAGVDVIATYDIAKVLMYKIKELCEKEAEKSVHNEEKFKPSYEDLLSHKLQLPASVALDKISRYGFYVDQEQLLKVKNPLETKMKEHLAILEKYQYRPGNGSDERFQELVKEFELKVPKTQKTGKFKSDAESLEKYKNIEWVNSYIEYHNLNKMLSFLQIEGNVVHTRFNTIVATGRTSSSKPNIQNVPRGEGIRGIFSARPKKGIISRDYKALEMATLAQVCFDRYGFSKMRDLINEGVDLHKYYASKLLNIPMDQVSKDARQKAKAVNFGFPGGLGIVSFIEYAAATYGVVMNEEEAKKAKQVWLDTFPEMEKYLKENKAMSVMLNSGLFSEFENVIGWGNEEVAYWIFKGIISGQTSTKSGRDYSDKEIEWAFDLASKIDFPEKYKQEENKDGSTSEVGFINDIVNRRGKASLWSAIENSFNSVIYRSGRVRGNCRYTESKNSPFQGLASDGAKKAVINLIKAGFNVINFIHDEVLVEVDLDQDNRLVDQEIARIMEESMKEFVPDVKIETEGEYMINWSKTGTHILDERGRFVPIQKEEKLAA